MPRAAEDWLRVKEAFEAATDLAPAERTAFLHRFGPGDESLRREVESLLASDAQADGFIEDPGRAIPRDALERIAAEEPFVARQFGPYRTIREIGRGGLGTVYLAARSDAAYEKEVAVKLLRRGLDTDDILRRFRNERQILARLDHPNIARLIDGGTSEDGLPFFVMEFVPGMPLNTYCETHGLTTNERLKLFRTVCAAITYAHQNLVIHRDLKPSNILVTNDGEVKLLDFGIAKLLGADEEAASRTMTSQRVMTPEYASPEQARGEAITTTSDVYSLGVVLYELLTGAKPSRLTSQGAKELESAITDQSPERPSTARDQKPLRGDLGNIVLKALRKEPPRRYESAAQFSEDIRRYLEGLPVRARKDTFTYRASRFVGRNRLAVTAASIIFVTLVSGIVMTAREKRKADRRFNDVRQMANSFIFEADDAIQKGPTQARAMLVRRTLTYLDRLAQESGNDRALQLELAAGYLRVGDVQGLPYRPNLGDSTGALASYRKAEEILRSMTATDPGNLEARRYLSIAWQSIGRLQGRLGDWSGALASEREAVAISEALVSAHPDRAPYRSLLADNYLHLGEALYKTERGATVADHREAIAWFRKALHLHQALGAAEPGTASYRYAVGVDYEYIGIAFNNLGDLTGDPKNYAAALENYRAELKINEALAASDPGNGTYRRILADVYGEVGHAQLNLKRTTEALENFRRALTIFAAIRASDPTNVEAQRDVANAYFAVSQALAQSGDLSAALELAGKAVAINQELSKAEPANAEARGNLLLRLEALGEMREKTGDVAGALENYQQALFILESWSKADPKHVVVRQRVRIEEANVARINKPVTVAPQASSK